MNRRLWFYLATIIIVTAELVFFALTSSGTNRQIATIEKESLANQQQDLERFLKNQTDERKLISLAKLMKNTDSSLVKMIAEKAYDLNPDSRDAVLLASAFHPDLKTRLLELDPLYQD